MHQLGCGKGAWQRLERQQRQLGGPVCPQRAGSGSGLWGGGTLFILNLKSPLRTHTFVSRLEARAPLGRSVRAHILASFRSVSGGCVEDGTSFLLSPSPDWWLGEWGVRPGHHSP